MVIDDRLVFGSDIVAVLEDAAQDESCNVVDAQAQGGFGKGFQNAEYCLVDNTVSACDQLLDQLPAIDGGSLIALGKRDIGFGHGFLQVLEQQVGEVLRRIGEFHKAHHEGVLVSIIGNGLADLGPISCQDPVDDGGDAVGERGTRFFTEFVIRGKAEERAGVKLHPGVAWKAGGDAPLARITHGGSSGNFNHRAMLMADLADIAEV